MATKKTTTKVEEKEVNKVEYEVIENFTEAGKTIGYIIGETYPNKNDSYSQESIEKLLGKNRFNKPFIKIKE